MFAGLLDDVTSGPADGELTSDGGTTWQAVSLGTGGAWSFTWQSNEVPNAQYTLQMRGVDQAGNVGDVAMLTLVVDNGPSSVSITERWWIWESGKLKVSPNHFPIASVRVTISDPQNRWSAVIMDFDPEKVPGFISWNRHFADRTLAPSGEYRAIAVACDINDLCGSDKGIVAIPFMATSTVTVIPSPTATRTLTSRATFTATLMPATPTSVFVAPSPGVSLEPVQPTRSIPLWQLLGLLGLCLVIASTSVIDPRPAALGRLSEMLRAISAQSENGSLENKQD